MKKNEMTKLGSLGTLIATGALVGLAACNSQGDKSPPIVMGQPQHLNPGVAAGTGTVIGKPSDKKGAVAAEIVVKLGDMSGTWTSGSESPLFEEFLLSKKGPAGETLPADSKQYKCEDASVTISQEDLKDSQKLVISEISFNCDRGTRSYHSKEAQTVYELKAGKVFSGKDVVGSYSDSQVYLEYAAPNGRKIVESLTLNAGHQLSFFEFMYENGSTPAFRISSSDMDGT